MGEEEEREKKSDEIATHSEISEVREPNANASYTPHHTFLVESAPATRGPMR